MRAIANRSRWPWARWRIERDARHRGRGRVSGASNPASLRSVWIRKEHAFTGIIRRETFDAAQAIIRRRQLVRCYSEQDLLTRLRGLLKKHGYLSQRLLRADSGGPQVCTHRRHFGTVRRALAQIGYTPPRQLRLTPATGRPKKVAVKTVAHLHKALLAKNLAAARNGCTGVVTINGALSIAVAAARCVATPVYGLLSWELTYRRRSHSDFVLLLRMDAKNKQPLDFWLLRRSMVQQTFMVLRDRQFSYWREYRCSTFDDVIRAVVGLPGYSPPEPVS